MKKPTNNKKMNNNRKSNSNYERKRIEEAPSLEETWQPKTRQGKMVKGQEITDIKQIFEQGDKIFETEVVDFLLPNLEEELLLVGQAKGKFGGGKKRIFRQTQKKTKEGNRIQFLTCAVVGNKNGYVGIGVGKSKETVPARDKSKRNAKLNLMKIRRGCGSWQCGCKEPHTVPFSVTGKSGSSEITLFPAPKGKGLCIESECGKILALSGIKDVWSKTKGQTKTKLNLIAALVDALRQLSEIKIRPGEIDVLGLIDGKMEGEEDIELDEVSGTASKVSEDIAESEPDTEEGTNNKPQEEVEGKTESKKSKSDTE